MPDAKGCTYEDHPQYIGIYWGPVSSPGCEPVLDWADVIVAAGPVFSDYTTAGWTGEPPAGKMINDSARDVRFADAEYTNVARAHCLAGRPRNVHGNDATLTQFHRITTAPAELEARNGDASAQLTRAELWHQIEQDLDPKSTLLCEGGSSLAFSSAFTLPARRRPVRDRDANGDPSAGPARPPSATRWASRRTGGWSRSSGTAPSS